MPNPCNEIETIPEWVGEIISQDEQTRFDRAHFKDFGDSVLNFNVVYYIPTADHNKYMDVQQKIILPF